jgi:amidophosphoribosyltransferase
LANEPQHFFVDYSDVKAGEAVFIDMNTGNCHTRMCVDDAAPAPCIFEYVYFARPDSIMDGVSVYESRLQMGKRLAEKIKRVYPDHGIDVVIPIPDTSRTSALQAAYALDRDFREGFIKNRYIARTFIMPGQAKRRKSVRLKLNTIKSEFAGRNVLLVDDSIVRGTTANEIVQMARDAGAKKVFFCSAAPPIRYPNVYGIDIPTREELIAYKRNEEEIAAKIGCDWVVYQDLEDLEEAVRAAASPEMPIPGKLLFSEETLTCYSTCSDLCIASICYYLLLAFDCSCFNGEYVTGEKIGDAYFTKLYERRNEAAKQEQDEELNAKNPKAVTRQQSSGGCESVSNDMRRSPSSDDMCESISNNANLAL